MSIGSIPSSINYNTIHNQSYCENLPIQSKTRSNSKKTLKKAHKLNKSVNNIDSASALRQSVNSSFIVPITNMSINLNNLATLKTSHHQSCSSNNDNEFIHFSKVEVQFAKRLLPLLDGTTFYKKFSSRQSLNENAFDPLHTEKYPPECCGYGIRFF